jgi:hypothetical protein
VKRYTPNSATPIGADTMFLQIGKRYTPFSALRQFFPTLLIICALALYSENKRYVLLKKIICAQVAAKHFMRNTR